MFPAPETGPALNRLARWAGWVIPVLFLIWLYHEGLHIWFSMDDFAWLSLLQIVRVRHDLLHELFAPAAQGTIRPWSDRGFFLLMEWLFGLNSIPYRIVVFATAAGSVLLLSWIAIRITGSRIAGFAAPILWAANSAFYIPMTWTSAYNEIMCSAFLLGALALLIRYEETGRRSYWWWQLVVFILGFGALETNVVYPALAAAWILFARANRPSRDREGAETTPRPSTQTLLCSQIPLALISVVYFLIHRAVAPMPPAGAYTLHFNTSIFRSILLYCQWALIPASANRITRSHHGMQLALILEAAAIVAFIAAEWRRGNRRVYFYLAWFAIPLAPLLPLTEHRTIYYILIPVIGLAMLGGEAVERYYRGPQPRRALLAVAIVSYLWAMIPTDRSAAQWWFEEAREIRAVYLGASSAQASHPGKAIVLDGIRPDIFRLALNQVQFGAGQLEHVYLAPESEPMIDAAVAADPNVDKKMLEMRVIPPEVMRHGITHNEVVVYSPESDHLRNVTEGYSRRLASRAVGRFPSRIDVGDFLYSWLLGPTWVAPESGVRWMPGSATLRIGVPAGGKVLELEGECPRELLVAPRHLMVLVDGNVVGDTRIYDPESTFHRLYPIPAALLAGKDSVEIEFRVDPVDRINGQDYGVLFGKIAIEP